MARRIAEFQKVSFERFKNDWLDTFGYTDDDEVRIIYDSIKLPTRATSGSAGYDFFSPLGFSLKSGEELKVPTGIRVKIEDGWVLQCYPRSSLGFKYGLHLNNTVGIIDSDYYYSDNEGHIFIKITNGTVKEEPLVIKIGDGFVQGIFTEYGITFDDNATKTRNGGFGSTNK